MFVTGDPDENSLGDENEAARLSTVGLPASRQGDLQDLVLSWRTANDPIMSSNPHLLPCMNARRITPQQVTSTSTWLVLQHIFRDRRALFVQGKAAMATHAVILHDDGGLFLHALRPNRPMIESFSSITSFAGGQVTDYRTKVKMRAGLCHDLCSSSSNRTTSNTTSRFLETSGTTCTLLGLLGYPFYLFISVYPPGSSPFISSFARALAPTACNLSPPILLKYRCPVFLLFPCAHPVTRHGLHFVDHPRSFAQGFCQAYGDVHPGSGGQP